MPIYRVPVAGLSRLSAAIGGRGNAYDAGYQQEGQYQSNMARALAESRLKNAQADQEEQQYGMRTPEAIRRNAALGAGIPESGLADVDEYLKTGRLARTVPLPANQQGPVEAAPEYAPQLGNVGRMIMSQQNALALGDKNSENVAKAYGVYDNLNKQDRVISGNLPASRLGQAVAASAGKALISPQEFGSVDLFTGKVDDSGGAAQRFGKKRISEAAENYAQGRNFDASADEHKAGAELKRSKKGEATTTTLPDGTVVATAPKPGAGGKIPAEVQRMNIALRSLDEGLAAYEDLLKTFDPRKPSDQLDPATRAKASSLVADLQLQLKEAQALGALTGPDLEILDKALASPTSLAGFVYGRSGLSEQLGQTRASMQRRRNALAAEYGRPDLAEPSKPKGGGPIKVDY